ncbi:MAG TPA: UbiX family flavin prenyltransferase [Trueperaceae bacterium]
MTTRLVVGVSGGSGTTYARDLLRRLRTLDCETHLVLTAGAKQVMAAELGEPAEALESLADATYDDQDLGAAISSGSFPTHGMIIVPCSAGTLAKVAHGLTDNLVARAAHVTLKERRPLVLVLREAPYSRPMLQNMLGAFDAGAIILPASPGFYHHPSTIHELISGITERTLDLLGLPAEGARRWQGS